MTPLATQDNFNELMKLLRSLAPMQGEAAANSFERYTRRVETLGPAIGLTEEDITKLVHENR
jgi:hypothetical protein